jgi:hypothetical protein
MSREIIYSSSSPNQEWHLVIYAPSAEAPIFYAEIQRTKPKEYFAFSCGISASPNEFSVQWDLPQDVCGLYVAQSCYAMFYYGINQRNKPRYRARTSSKKPFSAESIVDFGKENLLHYETWEGVYPIPDLHEGKCSWCRKSQNRFWVVLFEGASETIEPQSDVVCSHCVEAALEFIKMRKQGYSRKTILRDFDFRE